MNTKVQLSEQALDDGVLAHVLRDRERMRDALEHIANVCAGSRTSTRRLRWIATRCRSAVDDNEDWRDVDLPVMEPRAERQAELLKTAFPLIADRLAEFVDAYSTLSEENRKEVPFEAVVESLEETTDEETEQIREEVRVMRNWLQGTRRAVPEINIEELRKGGDWIEL